MYYVNLGQLLSENGGDIMKKLCDEKYLTMMDIPFIQYLVMYQWRQVSSTIKKRLLIPFFILLSFFFIYATFQIDWYRDEGLEAEVDGAVESIDPLTNTTIEGHASATDHYH